MRVGSEVGGKALDAKEGYNQKDQDSQCDLEFLIVFIFFLFQLQKQILVRRDFLVFLLLCLLQHLIDILLVCSRFLSFHSSFNIIHSS